jgi:hypothetical protein
MTVSDPSGRAISEETKILVRWLQRDSAAGWLAGVLFAALAPLLGELYGVPAACILGLALINASYGAVGLWMLGRVACGELAAQQALGRIARANLVWGGICMVLGGIALWREVPLFAVQLFGEGVVVGGLGLYEWRLCRA